MSACRRAIAAAALAAAVLLPAASRAADLPAITVAEPTAAAPYLLPLFIAQDLGWYKKDGLKVEEKTVVGDVISLRAVLSGDADVTDIGLNTVMQGYGSGRLRIIGSTQPVVDYRVIARPGSGVDLKSLSDKRWAISGAGGMLQAIPKMMMTKAGVDSSNAQFMPVGGLSVRYQAVVGGTVDASLVDTALAVLGEREKKTQTVRSVAQDFPGLSFVYLATTSKALADPAKHRALEILVEGVVRGTRLIMDNPQQAAQIMEARLKDTRVEMMTQVLKEMTKLGVWGPNGGLRRPVYDFSAKLYRDNGDVQEDIKYDQLVDASLAGAAVKKLGRR